MEQCERSILTKLSYNDKNLKQLTLKIDVRECGSDPAKNETELHDCLFS